MVYKKYIKRGGKTFGPYVYHSRKINGKVISEYQGKYEKKTNKNIWIFILIGLVLLSLFLVVKYAPDKINFQSLDSAKEFVSRSIHSLTGLDILEENTSEGASENNSEVPIIEQNATNETIIQSTNNSNITINETENISNITSGNEIINESSENFTINESDAIEINITEINITNETIINITGNITETNVTELNITNETLTEIANATISTIQYQAVLGQPVKWKKTIMPDSSGNLTITVPEQAVNIAVTKISENVQESITSQVSFTGAVIGSQKSFLYEFIQKIIGAITGNAIDNSSSVPEDSGSEKAVEIQIDEPNASYEVEYETPAPYSVEEEKPNGKMITIVGPDAVHYENVLAFTNLSEVLGIKNPAAVKIYWVENNTYLPPSVQDTDSNGIYDYVEWTVPHLSNQTFEIIAIAKAEHLNLNREFISDISDSVRTLDDVWSETISDNEYVRVTFEMPLNNTRDITLYPRVVSGSPTIEVYENNGTEKIAEFSPINSNEYNKVLLTNLVGQQDTFDLRVMSGSVELDYIVDPTALITTLFPDGNGTYTNFSTVVNSSLHWAAVDETPFNNSDYVGTGTINANDSFSIQNFTLPAQSLINNVTVVARAIRWNTTRREYMITLRSGSTDFNGSRLRTGSAYGYNTTTWTTDPATGARWTETGVNNLEAGVRAGQNATGGGVNISQFYVNVSYTTDTLTANWSANSTNSTTAGMTILHSVKWSDDYNLSGYIFSFDNGIGTFTNDTPVSMIGTANWSNVTKVVNSTVGTIIRWMVYANDSVNNLNVTDTFQYTTISPNPQWFSPSINDTNPHPNSIVSHNVNWTDDIGLRYAILEINSSGVNCNTLANVTTNSSFGGTTNWSNLTWTIPNACEGKTIGWTQYANDTSNNWNETDLQAYVVQSIAPITSFGTNPVDNYNSSSSSITFDLKVSDNNAVNGLSLYGNWSGTWIINQTNSSPVNNTFWNVTVTGIPEGRWLWAGWGNDTSGNSSFTTANRTLTVDLTNPASAINAPGNDTWTNDSTEEINITLTDNLDSSMTYNLWVNDSINKTGSILNNTATNVTLDAQPEGLRWIIAEAIDDSGRRTNSSTLYLKIDTIIPQISFTTGTENNATTKNQQFIFANVSVTEINLKNITYTLQNTTGIVNQTTYTTYVNQTNWTNLNNSNVQYWYNVTVYDTANNYNKTETRYLTLISNQAPAIAIIYPANATTYNTNVSQLNYSATDDAAVNSCWYSLNGQANSSPSSSCSNFTGLTSTEGSNTWTVYANDSQNAIGGNSTTFTKDTIAPAITLPAYANATIKKNTDSLIFNLSVSDAVSGVSSCVLNIGGGTNQTVALSNGWCNGTYALTGLSDGNKTINAYANDSANNFGLNNLYVVLIDSTPPAISLPLYANATVKKNTDTLTLNISVSDATTAPSVCLINANGTNTTITVSNGWCNSTTIPLTNLGDGNKTIRAYANDSANNFGLNNLYVVLVDTNAPIVSFGANPVDNYNSSGSSVTFDLKASDNISVAYLSLYGNWTGVWTANQTNSSPINNTFWNTTVNAIPDGKYVWAGWANDSAGNSAFTTANRTLMVDTLKPLIIFGANVLANNTNVSANYIFANVSYTEINPVNITFRLYNNSGNWNTTTYTTSSNTTNISINWTGLANGVYDYNATVYDIARNSNTTQTNRITLDTTNPSVLLYSPANNTNSSATLNTFIANVSDNIFLRNVSLMINGTVNQTNTSMINGVPYSFSVSLPDGLWNWSYRVYDYTNNSNTTAIRLITVDTLNPSITSLTEYPSDPAQYSTANVYYSFNATITDANLYAVIIGFDGVNHTASQNGNVYNYTVANLSAGAHGYYWYANDSAGRVNQTANQTYTITPAVGSVFTYLNNSRANATIIQGSSIYLNGTLQNGVGNIKLYNNGVLINQGTTTLSNLTTFSNMGTFNITTFYDGNANYTSAYETWYVIVPDTASPQLNLTNPINKTYNAVQTSLNYTVTDNVALSSCWYSLDGGTTNSTPSAACQNITGLTSNEGSNNWLVYANDTSGNKNSSAVTFFVDSINPAISFATPTEENNSQLTKNYIQVNATASDTNLNAITIRLYDSSNQLLRINYSASSPFFINYTGLSSGNYSFNATANDTVNNQNSTETRQVSLILPALNIIKPENKTYLTTQNLELNFTASNQNYVWYNLDSGSNKTIAANTTFNTTEGAHTFFLYANNSNGETAKNVTFDVDSSKFIIAYEDYANTTKGNSTNFNSSSYEDLQNLSGIIFENTNYGKLQFNESINITNDLNASDNQIDLNSNIIISSNFIEINSTALPNFNKSATLSLYGLTFSNPRILRNGDICPAAICTKQDYSGGTLIFSVTQFSNYSSEESPAGTIPAAPTSSGGGTITNPPECTTDAQCTGGKVCWQGTCVKLFDVKITDFKSPVKLGDFFEFTYFLKGQADINSDVIVNFWIQNNTEKVTTGSDTIYMGSFEERTETAKIFLPTTLQSGVYEFYVEVYHERYQASSHRTIQIVVKDGVATITNVGPDMRLYLIFGLILLILILLFIIHLRRDARKSERQPARAREKLNEKELPQVEKEVHEKKHLLHNLLSGIKTFLSRMKYKMAVKSSYKPKVYAKKSQIEKRVPEKSHLLHNLSLKIKIILLRINYWFSSIKVKHEAGIYKKEIPTVEEEVNVLKRIFDRIHVAFLRIKYGITSIKPKYEAGIYGKELFSAKHLPQNVLKQSASKSGNEKKKELKSAKPKKEPKTVKEIIEELKKEADERDNFMNQGSN